MTRRYRSAVDGKFVSAEIAEEFPETTVSEEVKTLEISVEMIEAGAELLSAWANSEETVEDCVIRIYIAMRSLEK